MKSITYFKALSDETRFRLLHLLCHYELNVNEIVEIMDMGQSRISRHLKILSDSLLVVSRRSGLWVFYSAAKEGEGYEFLEAVRYLLHKESILKEDLIRAREIIAERSSKSNQFFDSIAGNWGKMRREILGKFDLTSEILKLIDSNKTIVDLGCGSGSLLPELCAGNNEVIGVDRSARMLDEAGKTFNGRGMNIDLRIGDLEHLPMRDGEVDIAILNMVLHHLLSPLLCLKEAYRVLQNNSKLIIADFLAHKNEEMRNRYQDRWLGFTLEEMENWLKVANFLPCRTQCFELSSGLTICLYQAVKKLDN